MSKAVLISIRKEHNDKIFAGKKKWEGRKTCPSNVEIKNYIDPTSTYNKTDDDVKFFVYEPKTGGGCGKVIGEFICDFAQSFHKYAGHYDIADYELIGKALCVSKDFARSYFNKGKGYMIRVNEPKRYDQPKELSEFSYFCDTEKNQCGEGCKCYKCDHQAVSIEVIDGHRQAEHYCEIKLTRPPQSWCYVEER